MADLKAVYAAVDEPSTLDALDTFAERWDKKYPKISQSWRDNWAHLSTYFKYTQEVRRLIYTTNAIERFNRQPRKVTQSKSKPSKPAASAEAGTAQNGCSSLQIKSQ